MQSDYSDDEVDDSPPKPLEIACDTASAAGSSGVFSLCIAALAGYAAYSMTRGEVNWSRDWPILGAFVILFPAVAAFLVLSSIWATILWRKQGKTVLRIPDGFVAEGETMRGLIVCARSFQLRGPARVRLECLEKRTVSDRRHDDGTRTETRNVWSSEQLTKPETPKNSAHESIKPADPTCFAISFKVPEIRRVSERNPTAGGTVCQSSSLNWTLTLQAPLKGIDFEAHFAVPIVAKHTEDDLQDNQPKN